MSYNYCLYCKTEHYPFCGTNCKGIDIDNASDDVIACDCLYDPEFPDKSDIITVKDIKGQRDWLESPEGKSWLAEMSS